MDLFLSELKQIFKGEVTVGEKTREAYSHDSSIYELKPEAVLYPKNSRDIQTLVKEVTEKKALYPSLAITPRSAGTCMAGGPLSESIVIDMLRHFNTFHALTKHELHVQPGVYMRDVDAALDKKQLMLGCVPASRALNTIGGMVGNNSAGEQSLRYGNTENFVTELKVVLADGNEYTIKPLSKHELEKKFEQDDFEGMIYREIYQLIEDNYDTIKNARPKVNKNSMGYNLWSVWDRDTQIFDLTRLFCGSQGTLGIITDVKMRVLPKAKHSGILIMYLKDSSKLGYIIARTMDHEPATFEGFDDITFELGVKHFKLFKEQLGVRVWAKEQAALLGSVMKFKGHLPNMVLMAEFEGDTIQEVSEKIAVLDKALKPFNLITEEALEGPENASYWQVRRASLALLRQKVHDKYASPFIDDLTVQPKYLPEFLPQLRKIIRKHKLAATIAGHFGDGNFHIIPLMSIVDPKDQALLEPVMREVIPLVLKYNGTLAGEHNDGMVRGPWLPAQFGHEVFDIFCQTKELFDPLNIFNPHKKTDADWDYSMSHIRKAKKNELIILKNT